MRKPATQTRSSQFIPWQRKAAYYQGQVVRLLRANGNRDAQQIAKEELRPWIDFLQTLPDAGTKAVING